MKAEINLNKKYEIREIIYRGANLEIARAESNSDQQSVILKIHTKRDTNGNRHKLRKEYETCRSIPADFCPKPLEIEETPEQCILVFADDGMKDLEKTIPANGFEPRVFLRLATSMAKAIAHLHSIKMIHGKIAAPNCIVNKSFDQVKLIDFEAATKIGEGSLDLSDAIPSTQLYPYISPEQTGRIEQGIDFRTDLYSLGITFYKMSTGQLPFSSKDPIELIHAHIARIPTPPDHLRSDLAPAISKIILKLLEKDADERYQSAQGLIFDLEICLESIDKPDFPNNLRNFIPGGQDSSGLRFLQKLYGRSNEINLLRNQLAKVCKGATEFMLISGESGVGKSTFVTETEIIRDVVVNNAYFGAGKNEKLLGNVAYSAISEAFSKIIGQILCEKEERISEWKSAFQSILGPNGQVMVDIIPPLELIIGKQKPLQQLGAIETENRFHMVFRNFLRVFEQMRHPLVLFLDDLQWSDPASLDLVKSLASENPPGALFFIGAYRSDEVSPGSDLENFLEEIDKTGIRIQRIDLSPLGETEITQFVSETLKRSSDEAKDLAKLIQSKTGGNPFFVKFFLQTLSRENMIYGRGEGEWEWNLNQILESQPTDNVAQLMSRNIQSFPKESQKILADASCIGNHFRIRLLAQITGEKEHEIEKLLEPMIQAGVLLKGTKTYSFLHDRVLEAAYKQIPESDLPAKHLAIGRILNQTHPGQRNDAELFQMVEQLNKGRKLIEDTHELINLANLNLQAGRRAKASVAYNSACRYFRAGTECLADSKINDDLSFDLFFELAEAEFLTGDYDAANQIIESELHGDLPPLSAAKLFQLRTVQFTIQSKYSEAIATGRMGLKLLGITLPESSYAENLSLELQETEKLLGKRDVSSIVDLPTVKDPEKELAMQLLVNVAPAAWIYQPDLYSVIVAKSASISLQYGISAISANIFATLGVVLATEKDQFERGYQFSRVGMQISEKFDSAYEKCKAFNINGAHVSHWVRHIRESNEVFKEAYDAAMVSGGVQWAGYISQWIVVNLFCQGAPLGKILEEIDRLLVFNRQAKHALIIDTLEGCRLIVAKLLDPETNFFSIPSEVENDYIQRCLKNNSQLSLCNYYAIKGYAYLIFSQYEEAAKCSSEGNLYSSFSRGTFTLATLGFIGIMAKLLSCNATSEDERKECLAAIADKLKILDKQRSNAPMNFGHFFSLTKAEIARMENCNFDAVGLYDEAIESAKTNEFMHDEGLANELAAKFWLAHGRKKHANRYLREAYRLFREWGSVAKISQMEQEYGSFLAEQQLQTSPVDEQLDNRAFHEAIRAISKEIITEKLLNRLVQVLSQNAGAQRGYLILESEQDWSIAAGFDAEKGSHKIFHKVPIEKSEILSEAIVRYVIRTGKHLILHNASIEGDFTRDPYIKSNSAKSVLAMPIHHKSRILGAIFLENCLNPHVFSKKCEAFLETVLAQAAISLENARLYSELQKGEERLRSILVSMTDIVLVLDKDGRFIDCHAPSSQALYKNPDFFLGKKFDQVLPENLSKPLKEEIDRARLNFTNRRFDYELPLMDKSTSWSANISPRFTQSGEYEGVTIVSRDMTEQKLMEERLRQSEKMDAIGQLAGGVAHDFNNQLGGILGCANLLERSLKDPVLLDYVFAITKAASRAADLTRQLLAFSRKGKFLSKPTDIHEIIGDTVKLLSRSIDRRIQMKQSLRAEPSMVNGDHTQLQNALLNIGLNARDAMPDGGELIFSTSIVNMPETQPNEELQAGKYLQISIADTGIGMDAETKKRIFEPFFTTKEFGQGTGLGLAAVYGTVKNHSGTIRVYSEPGHGSSFNIYLPLIENLSTSSTEKSEPEPLTRGQGRILVVDDEKILLQTCTHMLEALGYEVIACFNPLEALDMYQKEWKNIHLVMLDMIMPKMGGKDLFLAMKSINPQIKAILSSGFTINGEAQNILNDGVKDFVQKPFTLAELSSKLEKVLKS